MKTHSYEYLENLTTKRLLSFYKAERARFLKYKGSHTCECDDEYDWNLDPKYAYFFTEKEKIENWQKYLNSIKGILNKRENIEK